MKNKSKILPKVILIILIVSLISTLVLSSVYAKYVSKQDPPAYTTRPAAFELIMKPTWADNGFNFAADGEPGNPIGHTEAAKDFHFEVQTYGSEVAADYKLEVKFSNKLTKMIYQARKDKLQIGVWCDYEVYEKGSDGKYVKVSGTESIDMSVEPGNSSQLVWTYSTTIDPNENPNGTTTGRTEYFLRMIVYNNTTMPSTGNTLQYVLSTDGIEISVTSTQVDPNFVGQYAGT